MAFKAVLGLTVLGWGVVQAAEPPSASVPVTVAPTQTVARPETAGPAPTTASTPAARPPLDLRLRDIREYLTPEQFQQLLEGRDVDDHTVIVRADAPLAPMKSELDVPGGIIAPFWALANPHKAWRLFLPDPRVDITRIPPPETAVPPPVFRWGP